MVKMKCWKRKKPKEKQSFRCWKRKKPKEKESFRCWKRKKPKEKQSFQYVIAKIQKENDNRFWNKVFQLSSEPVWYIFVIAVSYVSIMVHLVLSVDGACTKLTDIDIISILYLMDAFYMIDVILTIASKYIPNLDLPEINISMRPIGILLMEMFSVIPVELLVVDERLFCILRTNRSIRIVRVLHYFYQNRNLSNSSPIVRIIEMFSSMIFIVMVFNSFYCNIECYFQKCTAGHICVTKSSILIFASKVTTSGFSKYPEGEFNWELLSTLAEIFSYFLVYITTMCYVMVALIYMALHRHAFINRYNVTMLLHDTFKTDKYLRSSASESYNTIWQTCGGYNNNYSFLDKLPPSTQNEILLDICWHSFQHSHLFRSMDLPFLRYIATFVKHEIVFPGEFIYKKNEIKDKMIYIVYGSLQLLSEEDGESPIMTMISGTCLGESSLFYSYESTNNVCCKALCELHVLNKGDFLHAIYKFPYAYSKMRSMIQDRITNAKETKDIADRAKGKVYSGYRKIDTYTIYWIKNVLHRLMSKDADSTYRHELQNIYLLYDVDDSDFNSLIFCAKYLDMYAIGERIEADIDTVFVRTTFPCILQPTSFAVYLWEFVIITVTVILSFLIPYAAFVSVHMMIWYEPFILISTLIFWFDIYVQLSIAMKTRTSIMTKVSRIANAKMESFGFWLDMVSCFPCEIFSTFVLDVINNRNIASLHLNRLTKLWRVERLFRMWEKHFNANVVLIRFVKFSWINLYTVFVSFCYLFRFYPQFERMLFFLAVQVTTCTGILFTPFDPNHFLFSILDVLCTFINMSMYAHIGSAFVMSSMNKLDLQHFCSDLLKKIERIDSNNEYSRRIADYINTQWSVNECAYMKEKDPFLANLSSRVDSETMEFIAADKIKTITLFDGFTEELITKICAILKMIVLPPNEFVTYTGDFHDDIYMLQEGTCELLSPRKQTKTICTFEPINLLEVLFRVPSANLCVTRTYCRFFVFDYENLVEIIKKHSNEMVQIKSTIKICHDIRTELLNLSREETLKLSSFVYEKKRSFNLFSYALKLDSYEEYDYFIPFDRLYPFGCIRYLLLRLTILPDGRFMFIWEYFRCIFAFLTTLLNFAYPFVESKYAKIVYFLDFTAAMDILVRLHVCYYNDDGILVKHPLKTAQHYFTHGFLVDFLGMLPLGALVTSKDYVVYFTAYAFKLLQFHRYYQFINYLQAKAYLSKKKAYGAIYIPPMLILCNFCGSLLVNMECEYGENGELLCANDSMIENSFFDKPVSAIRGHLYGVYAATCVLTKTGWQGFETRTPFATNYVSVLTTMGLFISTILVGKMLTLTSYKRGRLLDYQEAMKSLKHFMLTMSVSHELQRNIIDSFEKKWKRLEGESIYFLIDPFNKSLKLDVLYEFFGRKMYQDSVFRRKTKAFYRNLLPHLQLDLIFKGGYAQTINDVGSNMYIILSGRADVLAPDGSYLADLNPGSIFGNIENAYRTRQRVSVVAVSHIEILLIESKMYHLILKDNPEIREEFYMLKSRYLSYIPSRSIVDVGPKKNLEQNDGSIFQSTLDPNTKSVRYWSIFNVVFSCYFGILIDFYQVGSAEFSVGVIVLQYTSDLLYLVLWLLQNRTAYEDESGNLVTDIKMIKARRRKNKITWWINIISLQPLDVIVLMLRINDDLQGKLFALARLNRILRLAYIFDFFSSSSKKLNVNIYMLRFGNLLLWASLVLNAIAAILSLLACSVEMNMHPHVPSCTDIHNYDSWEKFKFYIHFFYLIADSMALTGQTIYYPQGELLIMAFIVVMLIGQNLFALCVTQIFGILIESNNMLFTYRSLVDRVMYFLRRGGVSPSLVERVHIYLELLWIEQHGIVFPKLLQEAPLYLQDAVLNDAFSYLIIDHPVFAKCHVDCLRQIVQKMRNITYFQGDYVEFKGAIDETMYFIIQGEIIVLKDDYLELEAVEKVLKGGDSFGVLQGLFRKNPHNYTFRATMRTMLITLKLQSWEYLLPFFPASRQAIYDAAEEYQGV